MVKLEMEKLAEPMSLSETPTQLGVSVPMGGKGTDGSAAWRSQQLCQSSRWSGPQREPRLSKREGGQRTFAATDTGGCDAESRTVKACKRIACALDRDTRRLRLTSS